ncbi:hypothetical protein COEREDRAFT_83427 [Coemansia reversa NRRL 1564]|uniref:Uncharacterized protein n=1 Tax=Coemansia reversa (strain ATCC 12441 / NRRL 1564) TaxID=763665 RepID=A0A2G5B3A4_COERN|nr:hypothetical protein COEREDRAFT_83427 [Coemansia reversa NRRL 1564]|eukprot:PIA13502.1 hypothetical protein COEREDRAFT_83427 [Coemansia reversa NRRL 1564]
MSVDAKSEGANEEEVLKTQTTAPQSATTSATAEQQAGCAVPLTLADELEEVAVGEDLTVANKVKLGLKESAAQGRGEDTRAATTAVDDLEAAESMAAAIVGSSHSHSVQHRPVSLLSVARAAHDNRSLRTAGSGSTCEQGESERRQQQQQRRSQGSYTLGRSQSETSSLYGGGGGSSLVGGAGGSLINGTALSATNGGAPTSGTLSPPYTLVNSDGASLRVHTGSIRERYMQRRISAIHEDDSDMYSDSRRSDSLFTYDVQSTSSRYYHHGTAGSISGRTPRPSNQRQQTDDPAGAALESDGMSVLSGLSEGGASTTRVRMATDRAYNALRFGPQAASLLSYYSGNNAGLHRVTSFATSSDPGGLPSAASYYDMYYLDSDGNMSRSGRLGRALDDSYSHDGSSGSGSGCGQRGAKSCGDGKDDIVSLIRSDVAVYGGAGEDVKFPFLPDNMSEFSSPFMGPSAGITDADRISRDYSEIIYYPSPSHYQARSPRFFDHHYQAQFEQTPQQQSQQQQDDQTRNRVLRSSDDGKKIKKKKRKDKDARLTPRYPRGKQRSRSSTADYAAASVGPSASTGAPRAAHGGVRHWMTSSPAVGPNIVHPWRNASHRYRHQSAGESAYQNAAVAAAVAAATVDGPSASSHPTLPADAAHTPQVAAIRPNAIMRFLKRIAPKN